MPEQLPENSAPIAKLTTASERARINGAKSRGPVTSEGHERSSRNSMKHGLTRAIKSLIEIQAKRLAGEQAA